MKNILHFILLQTITFSMYAQPYINWQLVYGEEEDEEINAIIELNNGNYVVGGIQSKMALSEYDMFLMGIDNIGTVLWETRIGGEGEDHLLDLTLTPDGNILAVGYGESNMITTLYNESDTILQMLDNHGEEDIWIAKLNINGQLIWLNHYGGSADDKAKSVYAFSDYYLIAGSTRSNDQDFSAIYGSQDAYLMAIDTAGQFLWAQNYGGSNNDEFADLSYDTLQDELVAVGSTSSSDFDVSGSNGGRDFWVTRFQPTDGTLLWEKTFGGSQLDYSEKVVCLADGGLAVVGSVLSEDGDVMPAQVQVVNPEDIWLIRLDEMGNMIWQNRFGGQASDLRATIIPQQSGDLGMSYITFDDNGLAPPNYIYDIVVQRITLADGLPKWTSQWGGSNYDFAHSMVQNQAGVLVLAGYSDSVDGDVGAGKTGLRHGADDIWIFALDDLTSISPQNIFTDWQVFYQPESQQIKVELTDNSPLPTQINIYDLQGKQIYQQDNLSISNISIDNYFWKNGLYFVEICGVNGCSFQKFWIP